MRLEKKIKLLVGMVLLSGLLGLLSGAKVFAAPKGSKANDAAGTAPESGKPASKKVLRFDSLTITGEAAKPNVFYLLNRKKILVRHEPEKRDLIKNLEKSVEGDPF